MAEPNETEIPKRLQDLFNKGLHSFELNNLDYAIDMFTSCIEAEPRFLKARKFLRAAEVQRFKDSGGGAMTHAMARLRGMPLLVKGALQRKSGKLPGALETAEKLLRIDPLLKPFVFFFVTTAEAAGMPEIAVETLVIARDHAPEDAELVERLGLLYTQINAMRSARDCFEQLVRMRPGDLQAMKLLKDSMARDSLVTDGWQDAGGEGSSFRNLIKNAAEAKELDRENKAVKTEDDTESMITSMRERIEREPQNINHRRALARMLRERKRFDEAVLVLEEANKISGGDPQVENMIVDTYMLAYDEHIAALRAEGREEDAARTETEKAQYAFDSLADRVTRYPTDLELRYQYGVAMQENGELDEAIRQFQLAQRNPKRRLETMLRLGRAFRDKGQPDMAKQQLQQAIDEIPTMTDLKKELLYEVGEVLESMGRTEESAAVYKQIYAVDIGYRDIAGKIARIYSAGN